MQTGRFLSHALTCITVEVQGSLLSFFSEMAGGQSNCFGVGRDDSAAKLTESVYRRSVYALWGYTSTSTHTVRRSYEVVYVRAGYPFGIVL